MDVRIENVPPAAHPIQWQLLPRLRSDILAAAVSAAAISPLVCLIDSTIMLRAATSCTFQACFMSFVRPVSKLPSILFFSLPARLVFGVYFGTFATANSIDTFMSSAQSMPANTVGSSTWKFLGTATVSTLLTVHKDSRMAQILSRGKTTVTVPAMTYSLFTIRDAITIYASFNLPSLLAPKLTTLSQPAGAMFHRLVQTESARMKTAQFILPAGIQLITTPIHLLGLDFYNRRHSVNTASRAQRIARDYGMAVSARVARIIPAFGVGGVLNTSVRDRLMRSLHSSP